MVKSGQYYDGHLPLKRNRLMYTKIQLKDPYKKLISLEDVSVFRE